MSPDARALLKALLLQRRVAALATCADDGAPTVSMVPFAAAPDGDLVVVHVSMLAAHTRQMLADPRVGLLVIERESGGGADGHDRATATSPLALGRVALQGKAWPLAPDDSAYAAARGLYLARLPQAAELFDFPDFKLFAIAVHEARLVAGFARAYTLGPDDLKRHLRDDPPD